MEEFQHSHNELVKKRETIYQEIYKTKRYLEELQEKLALTTYDIRENCIHHHKNHDWISERESGPYGERFFTCKHCNYVNE